MLTIIVPGVELFDDSTLTFSQAESVELELEHSLASLSKWESVWNVAFLGPNEKTDAQIMSYIKAMTVTPNVPDDVYARLTNENSMLINAYINQTMTATTFNELPDPNRPSREIITSEIIYYWMISLQIPLECEDWHLNRLFTLVKVLNHKNAPKKKQNTQNAAAQRRALNEARQRQYQTSG